MLGVGREVLVAAGTIGGRPTRPAINANRTTSAPTTKVSVRVIGLRARGSVSASVAADLDQAVGVVAGARMKAARQKTTNRTSRTIVNCQRRRSTPRRLR